MLLCCFKVFPKAFKRERTNKSLTCKQLFGVSLSLPRHCYTWCISRQSLTETQTHTHTHTHARTNTHEYNAFTAHFSLHYMVLSNQSIEQKERTTVCLGVQMYVTIVLCISQHCVCMCVLLVYCKRTVACQYSGNH